MKLGIALTVAASVGWSVTATGADLVFGLLSPPGDPVVSDTLPLAFKEVSEATNGEVTWRIVPSGALLGANDTLQGLGDGVANGGLIVPPYVPNLLPIIGVMWNTLAPGANTMAVTAAATETYLLDCPACAEESRKNGSVLMGMFATPPYKMLCRGDIEDLDDLRGTKVRSTGNFVPLIEAMGATSVSMDIISAISALQTGAIDCTVSPSEFLVSQGFMDTVDSTINAPLGISSPVIGMAINQATWDGFSDEVKQIHKRAAALVSAKHSIDAFTAGDARALELAQTEHGITVYDGTEAYLQAFEEYRMAVMESAIEGAKGFGVENPEEIQDRYLANIEKWTALLETVDQNDVYAVRDLLMSEIYDKVEF